MKNEIVICSPVWKRPEVFEKWVRCMQSLNPRPEIVVAGSPNDECEDIAFRYGVHYVEMPNKPVGAKWNEAHQHAFHVFGKDFGDYYLTTGSDDVMSQGMWDFYCDFKGERLVLTDLFFYELPTRKAIYWKGYKQGAKYHGYPIGASQLHSQQTMIKLDWKPFDPTKMAHEHDTENKCRALGIETTYVQMQDTGGFSVDLKSKGSYSPFANWPNTMPVNLDSLRAMDRNLWKIIEA